MYKNEWNSLGTNQTYQAKIHTSGNFKELVHYSLHLETGIIGVCLIEVDRILEVMNYIKTPEVFYSDINRIIFEAMVRLIRRGDKVDLITVPIDIERNGTHDRREYENTRFDIECMLKMRDVTGGEHLLHWCIYLIQFYVKREQIQHALNIWHYDDPLDAARQLQTKLNLALSFEIEEDWTTSSDLMLELMDRREKIRKGVTFGVPTGFKRLDQVTGGGFETGFIFIFARPGGGKTAFAVSLILNISKQNIPVGIISLEMPNVQLAGRLVAQEAKLPFKTVFKGENSIFGIDTSNEDEKRIQAASNRIIKLPFFTSGKTKVDIHSIRYKVKKLKEKHKARIIFIDYLQLVEVDSSKGKPRYVAVGELTRELKLLSTEEDIPIVALGQVNRESEGADKQSKPPKLSQARESGSIEQDADMGIGIDRPFIRGFETDEHGNSMKNVAFIDIQKHRNGATESIQVSYDPDTMRFYDTDESEVLIPESYRIPPADRSTMPTITPINDLPF